jgi:hypothetical protein
VLFLGDAGVALYQGPPLELRLDGVVNLISGEVGDGRVPVVLTIGRNALRIDLSAVAPTLVARQLTYRYRLEGFEKDWRVLPARSTGGKRASITYAGLPAGVYTFTAAARTDRLDHSPAVTLAVYLLSRPPKISIDGASVGGRPVDQLGTLQVYVEQPIMFQLTSADDQLDPLHYRYRIEGLGRVWTETTSAEISFTLSAAGTYTFVAMGLDDIGQSSPIVGSQIIVSEREEVKSPSRFPVGTIVTGLGVLSALLIGIAVVLIARRRRRESW